MGTLGRETYFDPQKEPKHKPKLISKLKLKPKTKPKPKPKPNPKPKYKPKPKLWEVKFSYAIYNQFLGSITLTSGNVVIIIIIIIMQLLIFNILGQPKRHLMQPPYRRGAPPNTC